MNILIEEPKKVKAIVAKKTARIISINNLEVGYYKKVLDDLEAKSRLVRLSDIKTFSQQYGDVTSCIDHISCIYEDVLNKQKIHNITRIGNFRRLKQHHIYCKKFYMIGLRVSKMIGSCVAKRSPKLLHNLITNIDILYKHCNIASKTVSILLALLIYEYMPFGEFEKHVAMCTSITQDDLPKGITMRMIKVLRRKYIDTNDQEYLNLLNLIIRLDSTSIHNLLRRIGFNFVYQYTSNYAEKAAVVYNKCVYTRAPSLGYDDIHINRSYSVTSKFMDPEHKDAIVNKVYNIIGMHNLYVPSMFKELIALFIRDLYIKDINMSDLSKNMILLAGFTPYEKKVIETINRANLKHILLCAVAAI